MASTKELCDQRDSLIERIRDSEDRLSDTKRYILDPSPLTKRQREIQAAVDELIKIYNGIQGRLAGLPTYKVELEQDLVRLNRLLAATETELKRREELADRQQANMQRSTKSTRKQRGPAVGSAEWLVNELTQRGLVVPAEVLSVLQKKV